MNVQTMKAQQQNYFTAAHTRWRIKKEKKAAKDIIGEEYENMRRGFWISQGFKPTKESIGSYDPDIVVKNKYGEIVVIEEDKGHYLDSCFLDRFMMNCARVLDSYLEKGTPAKKIPYMVLSCMTTYNLYEEKYKLNKKLFSPEIQKLMDEKIVYLPYCSHDRVRANKYFKSAINCFDVKTKLLEKQIKFVSKLRG